MTVRFVADTHFAHANIIKFDRRPWASVAEMDEQLIDNWNRVVKDEDITYHLGDVAMGLAPLGYLMQLAGQIRIIPGNHDGILVETAEHVAEVTSGRIQVIDPLVELKGVAHRTLWLCHYALEGWNKKHKSIHLHGHTHPAHDPYDPCPGLRSVDRRVNICMGSLFYGAPAPSWRPLTLVEILNRTGVKT